MRRLVFPIIVGLGLVMIGSSSASAEDPTPAATVSAKATPGKKLCKVTDPKLDEISGLVATKNGYIAINDSTTDEAKKKIFFLDAQCAIERLAQQRFAVAHAHERFRICAARNRPEPRASATGKDYGYEHRLQLHFYLQPVVRGGWQPSP